jgi:methylated-DNA-[protein]-cysteine S-methyltransferase
MGIAAESLSDTMLAVRTVADTMVGRVVVAATDAGVIWLATHAAGDLALDPYQPGKMDAAKIADQAEAELIAYFSGELRNFSVPVCLDGLSGFQRLVLEHVARIPYGQVETYGEVAMRIGKAGSARAVGGALARNPIGVIIPCHRVVAHDGRMHGFSAREGIHGKAKLLQHEGINVRDLRVRFDEK